MLEERLAVGGMGEVWRARDEVLGRGVAVKILRLELAPDAAFQARFRAEARTAAGLSHGGIAAVYDYGEALQSAFLVMELVPGEPLSAMIAREGALGTDRTLTIVAQAARALHAAHLHGVVHRDIKPANLMVTPELRVKITDFGISRPRDHEPLTATGQVMGTAHYLAPELARGEVATPLSDVYALGIVTYECLAGWRPFEGDNQVAVATAQLTQQPPPLPETVPLPVRQLVASAMAKNPHARPQGAKAFALALEDLRLRQLASGTPAAGAWPTHADTPPGGLPAVEPDEHGPSSPASPVGPTSPSSPLPTGSGDWGAPPVRPVAMPGSGFGASPPPGAAPAAHQGGGGRGTPERPTPPERFTPPERSTPPERPAARSQTRAESRAEQRSAGGRDARTTVGSRSEARSPAAARPPSRQPQHGPGSRVTPTTPRRGGPVTTALPGEGGPGEGLRRLALPLIAAAGLVAVVIVVALLLNRDDDPSRGASPQTSTQPAATSTRTTPTPSTGGSIGSDQTGKQGPGGPIIVDASELVGRDIDDVLVWLRDNDVSYRISRTQDSATAGTVIDVSPIGTVELGERVTVTVSRGPG